MRFHGLLLVRDEADIISEYLRESLKWADSIWILDTGSTDGTWEAINEFANIDSRVRPFQKKDVVFGQNLRSYLFDYARDQFKHGDWIVKLDADEFFVIDPRSFVKKYVRIDEGCIYLQWYYFRITSKEVSFYEENSKSIFLDRKRSIFDRRRFYKLTKHTEPRMFKYRKSMKFRREDSFPRFAGMISERMIPIRHYPHRDPLQLKRRYALRSAMKRMGSSAGSHWDAADWRTDVVCTDESADRQACSEPSGLASETGHDDGPLYFLEPGGSLPSLLDRRYREPHFNRLTKKIFYRFFVRLADRFVLDFRAADCLRSEEISHAFSDGPSDDVEASFGKN